MRRSLAHSPSKAASSQHAAAPAGVAEPVHGGAPPAAAASPYGSMRAQTRGGSGDPLMRAASPEKNPGVAFQPQPEAMHRMLGGYSGNLQFTFPAWTLRRDLLHCDFEPIPLPEQPAQPPQPQPPNGRPSSAPLEERRAAQSMNGASSSMRDAAPDPASTGSTVSRGLRSRSRSFASHDRPRTRQLPRPQQQSDVAARLAAWQGVTTPPYQPPAWKIAAMQGQPGQQQWLQREMQQQQQPQQSQSPQRSGSNNALSRSDGSSGASKTWAFSSVPKAVRTPEPREDPPSDASRSGRGPRHLPVSSPPEQQQQQQQQHSGHDQQQQQQDGGNASPMHLLGMNAAALGCDSCGIGSARVGVTPATCCKLAGVLWLVLPPRVYFKFGCLSSALTSELRGRSRALLVCGSAGFELGFAQKAGAAVREAGALVDVFHDIPGEPTFETVAKGVDRARLFRPDSIVAVGGGSVMDAAKVIWLLYEHPEYNDRLTELCARSADFRAKAFALPKADTRKCQLICVPTTSGTGSEVSPFAMIKDKKTCVKSTFLDYGLLPDTAVCDPEVALGLPKELVVCGGFQALSSALEAFVSPMGNAFTAGYALQAICATFAYLWRSWNEPRDREARESMHYASTLAGIAAGNSFLGLCHGCSVALAAVFGIPTGVGCALTLSEVVLFNAPPGAVAQSRAGPLYCRVAHALRLSNPSMSQEEQVAAFVGAVERLKAAVGVPPSIRDCGVSESAFRSQLSNLAEIAAADQAVLTNPRHAQQSDIVAVFEQAFAGLKLKPASPL